MLLTAEAVLRLLFEVHLIIRAQEDHSVRPLLWMLLVLVLWANLAGGLGLDPKKHNGVAPVARVLGPGRKAYRSI